MKRIHLADETPGEEEQQALVATLALNNVVGTLLDVPQLVISFRHHPWRLLRLMNTNRQIRLAVEYIERSVIPLMW